MSSKKILVVEDDAIASMDIQRTLQLWGYEVVAVASSGEEAVEITEELKPDLILMDVVLKGEMDGIDAAHKIIEILDIPV
ncbi:MAG: response regulator, partial [Euryarchaeota archaeon]|nr:response regulator [Euryarchaeota archaeon]